MCAMISDIGKKVNHTIQASQDYVLGEVNLRMVGKKQVFVENYKYIMDYSECVVRLQCRNCRLKILGKRLVIEYFSKEDMLVKGNIQSITFE